MGMVGNGAANGYSLASIMSQNGIARKIERLDFPRFPQDLADFADEPPTSRDARFRKIPRLRIRRT